MAQGRIRRLVTTLLRWVWVPVVSFVLVVALAMACAVWSPLHHYPDRSSAAIAVPSGLTEPLRQYEITLETENSAFGFGVSLYVDVYKPTAVRKDQPELPKFVLLTGRAGLPFRCMRWTVSQSGNLISPSVFVRGIDFARLTGRKYSARFLPLMPEAVGMVLNVLIYSAVIVLLRFAWRRAVVIRRRRSSLCIHCTYPLGDFIICPECGETTGREA